MLSPQLVAAPLVVAFLASFGKCADLAKIDRTIAKEPAYQSKEPKYCLLVFGREAKTRVWLVLDDDVLYVDRKGNGDLTEEGNRVTISKDKGRNGKFYQIGEITESNGKIKHTELEVSLSGLHPWFTVLIEGMHTQFAGIDSEVVKFADHPQEAPIIHFGGPLTIHLSQRLELVRNRKKASELFVELGTPGLGKGTFAAIENWGLPGDFHPSAEIEWPPKTSAGQPIRTKVILNKRC